MTARDVRVLLVMMDIDASIYRRFLVTCVVTS